MNFANETTAHLLDRVQSGDADAQEKLFQRFLPLLQRWARGRIPLQARSFSETDDLVQTTLLNAFRRLPAFEHQGEGSFLAYLRTILMNEIRKMAGRPHTAPLEDAPDLVVPGSHPKAQAQAFEAREKYEKGLAQLNPLAQQAIILRLEFEYSYEEIAIALEKASADAARMFVTRSIQAMAKAMEE
ncbi:MAG: RNA polymerase sigma factor [Acidobacteria bacterium]|nr:RNA polymerase sigma factor [Acidobacteriota bacterium]MCB9397683.1 RNA polymerase sigma factor [Acidobacteriota bacterium]